MFLYDEPMTKSLSPSVELAWIELNRAQQAVLASVEADLKVGGFPPLIWYDLLLELKKSGKGGLRPKQLQQRMLLAQYNVSRLADRLALAGYLNKNICDEDGRGFRLTLTKDGRRLLQRMWPVYARALRRHMGDKLTDAQAASLAGLLKNL